MDPTDARVCAELRAAITESDPVRCKAAMGEYLAQRGDAPTMVILRQCMKTAIRSECNKVVVAMLHEMPALATGEMIALAMEKSELGMLRSLFAHCASRLEREVALYKLAKLPIDHKHLPMIAMECWRFVRDHAATVSTILAHVPCMRSWALGARHKLIDPNTVWELCRMEDHKTPKLEEVDAAIAAARENGHAMRGILRRALDGAKLAKNNELKKHLLRLAAR